MNEVTQHVQTIANLSHDVLLNKKLSVEAHRQIMERINDLANETLFILRGFRIDKGGLTANKFCKKYLPGTKPRLEFVEPEDEGNNDIP